MTSTTQPELVSPNGESLAWPAVLGEWTRLAQSCSLKDAELSRNVPQLVVLLREGMARLQEADTGDLLSWWPAYGQLLRELSLHPLILLSPVGRLILSSSIRAMRRFSSDVVPIGFRDQCRRATDWCTQFIRHLSGGNVLPVDGTDALLRVLDISVEESHRAQMEDAVDAVVAAVKAQSSATRALQPSKCPRCCHKVDDEESAAAQEGPSDEHFVEDAFAQHCALLLSRALQTSSQSRVTSSVRTGPPRDRVETASCMPGYRSDFSGLVPLVAALAQYAGHAMSHNFVEAVTDAYSSGALPVLPSTVALLLTKHPKLLSEQLGHLLRDIHHRPWLMNTGAPTEVVAMACASLKPLVSSVVNTRRKRPRGISGTGVGGEPSPASSQTASQQLPQSVGTRTLSQGDVLGMSQGMSQASSHGASQEMSQLPARGLSIGRFRAASTVEAPLKRLAPVLYACGSDTSLLRELMDALWDMVHQGSAAATPLAMLRLIMRAFDYLLEIPTSPFLVECIDDRRGLHLSLAGGAESEMNRFVPGDRPSTVVRGLPARSEPCSPRSTPRDDCNTGTIRSITHRSGRRHADFVRETLWPSETRPIAALLRLDPSRHGIALLKERVEVVLHESLSTRVGATTRATTSAHDVIGGDVPGVAVHLWRLLSYHPEWYRHAMLEAVDVASITCETAVPIGEVATVPGDACSAVSIIAWALAPARMMHGPDTVGTGLAHGGSETLPRHSHPAAADELQLHLWRLIQHVSHTASKRGGDVEASAALADVFSQTAVRNPKSHGNLTALHQTPNSPRRAHESQHDSMLQASASPPLVWRDDDAANHIGGQVSSDATGDLDRWALVLQAAIAATVVAAAPYSWLQAAWTFMLQRVMHPRGIIRNVSENVNMDDAEAEPSRKGCDLCIAHVSSQFLSWLSSIIHFCELPSKTSTLPVSKSSTTEPAGTTPSPSKLRQCQLITAVVDMAAKVVELAGEGPHADDAHHATSNLLRRVELAVMDGLLGESTAHVLPYEGSVVDDDVGPNAELSAAICRAREALARQSMKESG